MSTRTWRLGGAQRRTAVAVLALNVVLLGAWLWAQAERETVTVVASGSTVEAFVDGRPLVAAPAPTDHGRVGLYLGERGPTRGLGPPAFVARLSRESAWGSLTVRSIRDGVVLLRQDLGAETSPLAPTGVTSNLRTFGSADWQDYRVDAVLLRGREQAGVEVYGDAGGGLLLLFRPEHGDAGWWRVTDDGLQGPIASAPYRAFRKDLGQMIQDDVRLFLRAYPYALGLALLAGLVGGVGALVRRESKESTTARDSPFSGRTADGAALAPTLSQRERADESSPQPSAGGRESSGPPLPLGEAGARLRLPPGEGDSRDERVDAGSPATSPMALASRERTAAAGMRPRPPAGLGATGLALLASTVALALSAYVAYFVLEHMPHVQDSVAYLFQAKVFALGRLWVPTPQLPEFFTHEFVVMHDGKWFGKYPPGFPALLTVGVLAGAPWLVNPLASALSVFVVYLVGRRLYGPGTGLLAAALALVSPFFVFMSGSFMAHPTGLLFVLLFVWLFFRSDRWPEAFLAGAALGVAFLIRPWTAGAIAAPFAVVALAELLRRPRAALPRSAAMAAGLLPMVGIWLAFNAALTGDPLKNTMELWWPFDKVGFGPDHGPFGYNPLDGLWNTSRNMGELLTHLFGWPPFVTLGFAALPFVSGRLRKVDLLLLASFLSLVVGYALWWADGIMYGPRFYYEGLGFLLLLTARGVVEAAGLVQGAAARWGWRQSWVGPGVAGALLGLLVACNLTFYLPGQWQLYHGYNYVNRGPVRAVEAAGLHDALVFAYVGEWYEWWNYGMVFSSNSPLLDTDVIYARDLSDAENRKLMALYPGRSYYRLRGTTVTPITP